MLDVSGHWTRTKGLMVTTLIVWAIAGFGIHIFARSLNNIVIFGFPVGFYMAAQGSLVIFVLLIFWFAYRQDAVDREFGVAETD